MATDLKFPFVKKLILFLFGLQAILVPVAAAIKEQAGQKLPSEVVAWITVVTAPWPTYTFGVLYFVILMGILMGLIIYQAIAKTKIFEEGMGGAKGGVQIGITAILTLITIKFMPFQYYIMLTAILVLIAAFLGFYTLFEAATKYGGAEGKWKNTITVIGLGLVLVLVGYFLLQTFDEFQRLGVITGPAALTTQWPGAIAWLIIIAGIIFTCGGVMYAISSVGFSSTFGGYSGARIATAHEADSALNMARMNTEEITLDNQMRQDLQAAVSDLGTGNTDGAKMRMKDFVTKFQKAKKDLAAKRKDAKKIYDQAIRIEGVREEDKQRWQAAIAKLDEVISKHGQYEQRLQIEIDQGLHKLMVDLNAGRDIRADAARLLAILQRMTSDDLQIGTTIAELEKYIQAAKAAAGGAGGGGRPPMPGGP